MKSYLELWRRAFDYKGISSLRDFWLPFGIHAAVAVVMGVLFLVGTQATFIAAVVLATFLIISAVPFAALTVRRLHDVGKSGWWYFLWYGLGAGAVVLLIILACSGGGFSALDNSGECVYGPPEWFADTVETPEETGGEDTVPVPEEFNPDDNLEECVYGPPEWFE